MELLVKSLLKIAVPKDVVPCLLCLVRLKTEAITVICEDRLWKQQIWNSLAVIHFFVCVCVQILGKQQLISARLELSIINCMNPLLLSVCFLDVQCYFIKTAESSASEGRPSEEYRAHYEPEGLNVCKTIQQSSHFLECFHVCTMLPHSQFKDQHLSLIIFLGILKTMGVTESNLHWFN